MLHHFEHIEHVHLHVTDASTAGIGPEESYVYVKASLPPSLSSSLSLVPLFSCSLPSLAHMLPPSRFPSLARSLAPFRSRSLTLARSFPLVPSLHPSLPRSLAPSLPLICITHREREGARGAGETLFSLQSSVNRDRFRYNHSSLDLDKSIGR